MQYNGKIQMEKAAILGFAYGFRKKGLCKSNSALIQMLRNKHPELFQLPLIMEDDLARCLWNGNGHDGNLVYIVKNLSNIYAGSEMVAKQGIEVALESNYTTIYILAYPILHRQFCQFLTRRLAQQHHIRVRVIKTGWIPSDPLSEQWWTRNPLFPFIYAIVCLCFNRRGK